MNRFVRTNVLSWAVATVVLGTACEVLGQDNSGQPAPIGGEERDGVLVLQDGGVLVGHISRQANHYLVTRSSGEMRIPAAGVMLVAGSLDDAYQQRRQQSTRPDADAHLNLAEWCLRHDLMKHAEQELTDARNLDAGHRRLALLERRLAIARNSPPKQVAGESTVKPPPPAAVHSAQSEAGISDVHADVIERFTRRVQPILVNSCTTSGCHQPGGSETFQIDRAILRNLSNRRSTMQNLTATLALVDRERPQQSPLLTVPRQTHGGMKGPVFGPRQDQAFRHLSEWVALVTANAPSRRDGERTEDADLIAAKRASRLVPPVLRELRQSDEPTVVPPPTNSEPELRYGARLKRRWQPRDPFDPEIFNRQSGARAIPAGAAKKTPDEESR